MWCDTSGPLGQLLEALDVLSNQRQLAQWLPKDHPRAPCVLSASATAAALPGCLNKCAAPYDSGAPLQPYATAATCALLSESRQWDPVRAVLLPVLQRIHNTLSTVVSAVNVTRTGAPVLCNAFASSSLSVHVLRDMNFRCLIYSLCSCKSLMPQLVPCEAVILSWT